MKDYGIRFDDINENMLKLFCKYGPEKTASLCILGASKLFDDVVSAKKYPTHKDSFYVFIDRGADILMIAHLDTVQQKNTFRRDHKGKKTDRIFSPRLDDRLGVYTIMYHLRNLKYDILLTTDEEKGASTAADFVLPHGRDYNWMVEFDRGGTDVVRYQYGEPEWIAALESVGYDVDYGSFSDISDLDDLGCSGVNIGVAYQNYHGPNAYFDVKPYLRNIEKFVQFYTDYATTWFKHEPSPNYNAYSIYSAYGGYSSTKTTPKTKNVLTLPPPVGTAGGARKTMRLSGKTYYGSSCACDVCGSSYFEHEDEAVFVDIMGLCYFDFAWREVNKMFILNKDSETSGPY